MAEKQTKSSDTSSAKKRKKNLKMKLSKFPPETMPLAIDGPKMPRPSRQSEASATAIASSMVG